MTAGKMNKDGFDVAALFLGEQNTAICFVQVPTDAMERFEGIGRDDEGPFLVNAAGGSVRIGLIDQDSFDEALGYRNFRLHLIDETGLFVEEYDIAAIRPEAAATYGA